VIFEFFEVGLIDERVRMGHGVNLAVKTRGRILDVKMAVLAGGG
jgi:hypothetical protein